jgi:hypothetical protein
MQDESNKSANTERVVAFACIALTSVACASSALVGLSCGCNCRGPSSLACAEIAPAPCGTEFGGALSRPSRPHKQGFAFAVGVMDTQITSQTAITGSRQTANARMPPHEQQSFQLETCFSFVILCLIPRRKASLTEGPPVGVLVHQTSFIGRRAVVINPAECQHVALDYRRIGVACPTDQKVPLHHNVFT